MSEYLNTARAENFVGRQWLYREIEDKFKDGDIAGVLIIGNPGSGKSALASQLICSRTSSSKIHAHILGYHFCKYSDKNTQMAGKFVRNVAEMIARRLPEYGYIISNSSYIQRSFDADCIQFQDPVGCFEQTIITPLRNLTYEPSENWFIVLDALDECLAQGDTSHSIVYLLKSKIHRFPPWLKLVMTSRNESDASLYSSKVKNLIIDPKDSKNLDDIELFVTTRLYQKSSLLYRITSWFGDDSVDSTTKLITELLEKSQGNFLFVKEVLHDWELSRHELRDAYGLPKTLGDQYHRYFERLYPDHAKKKSFRSARNVLELLVSTFEPLTQKEIFKVLSMKEKNLDEEYDFKNRLEELSHFLKYGEDNTVTLYHLSLTEWLTREGNEKFFVSKKKGHEILCDYYFSLIKGGDKSTMSKYILTLAQHIAFGGWKKAYVQEFINFPSQAVNSSDPDNNRTLLHLAATVNSTDVLELLLRHFSCIDCVDNRGITPAFLAAEHGLVDNLALLVKKGADVNRKTKSMVTFYKSKVRAELQRANIDSYLFVAYPQIDMPVVQSKSKFFDASMLHAAAQRGHLNVVRYLLDNYALISTLNGVHLTAIQLAAENGHLEVVKALHEAGAVVDQTVLYHAAANNRLEVVNFLLDIGVRDKCLQCDGSFYWLKRKRRLTCSSLHLSPPFKEACSHMHVIDNDIVKMCIDLEKKWPDENSELFDDKHLIFCHSALHSAVASGHDKVVSRLLSEEYSALNCHDYTGRNPLHEAVRNNNTKIVDLLLQKQPQMIQYECKYWQKVDTTVLRFEELAEYLLDICHCGYTPLHLAARYGHKKLAISLILKGARLDDRDCSGATPIHVAACHNQAGLIGIFTHPNVGGDINVKALNGSTPLHSAAVCGAVEVIDYMLYKKANLTAVDDNGLTALHYSIFNMTLSWLDQILPRGGHLSDFFKYNKEITSIDGLLWLDTLLKLVFRGSNIDAVDIHGRTPLHVAAHNGLADAVNVLLKMNASLEKKDKHGKTPLEVALENAPIKAGQYPFLSATKIEVLRNYLHGHEMVVFLLLHYGASLGECKNSGSGLLHRAIINQQHNIVQLLLLKGASLTCKDSLGRTPLVTYLHNGGKGIDVVLRNFTVSVAVECGKPFNSSVFHLLSYRPPTFSEYNFFYSWKCNDDPVCNKGPLAVAIESHPRRQRIVSSCLDYEGFTPLHRAAQGANLVAIRYLLANDANDSILSPHGHDALTLAVLHAGKTALWRSWQLYEPIEHFFDMTQAEEAAIELLNHAMKSRGYRIICDSSKPELTLYHLAASRGLVKFIEVIFNKSDLHQLDVNCPNLDGITPMYLAKNFENNIESAMSGSNPWDQVIQVIKSRGGEMRYPTQYAEYNLIYNGVYGWIPNEFTLDLRADILHFIKSLLTSYEKIEKKSFCCSFGPDFDLNPEKYHYWEILWIWSKIDDPFIRELLDEDHSGSPGGINQCSREEEQFRKDLKRCSRYVKKFRRYLSRISWHRLTYPKNIAKISKWEIFNKVQRNWFQKELLSLMEMRHTEVFRSFACAKSLSYRLKPLLHFDHRSLTSHIRRYEERPHYNYLSLICQGIKFVFSEYLSHMKGNQMPSEFILREKELFSRLGFVNERMKIHRASLLGSFVIKWPLEFFLKRSLGFFRRYDYLKTVHVGIEPRTYVPLYTDKQRQYIEKLHSKRPW